MTDAKFAPRTFARNIIYRVPRWLRLPRSASRAPRTLWDDIERVVRRGNCSGCGACALLSDGIKMGMDAQGYMRPRLASGASDVSPGARRTFRHICPGVSVTARRDAGSRVHPTMGPYVSVWKAWATDEEIRYNGSSGGVLTALSAWLIESGAAASVVGAAGSPNRPTQTVPVVLRNRSDLLTATGSRYAPVSNAALFDPLASRQVFVGKPCETFAARQLSRIRNSSNESSPVLLSFFCAGMPSQHATDELVAQLGVESQRVQSLRYRGRGWPGQFRVTDESQNVSTMSYEESWGGHLGRQIQDRCKICPDGTGGHADIAVGDFWEADDAGYPTFKDADGVCATIARTVRGHAILMAAREAGVIALAEASMDSIAEVQPLQVTRRITLLGRLTGRTIGGQVPPRFLGYSLLRLGLRRPRLTLRSARHTFRRARSRHRDR